MNPATLGALRAIGCLLFFTVATAIVGIIPDILTQLPVVGALVTPTIAGLVTAGVLAGEHELADAWGYNIPAVRQ